jgi:hypothetical protein
MSSTEPRPSRDPTNEPSGGYTSADGTFVEYPERQPSNETRLIGLVDRLEAENASLRKSAGLMRAHLELVHDCGWDSERGNCMDERRMIGG